MPHAPAAIVCTSFSWPGTSIRPSTSPFVERHVRVAEFDRNAARLFFLQPIGIDARQRAHERRLTVVDMPRRSDDHARAPFACNCAMRCRFVGGFETAQIEAQGVVGDAADHRARHSRSIFSSAS